MRIRPVHALVALCAAMGTVSAQWHKPDYEDLTIVRNRRWSKKEFWEIRSGVLTGRPNSTNAQRFSEDRTSADGHVYYHAEGAFDRPQSQLDAYVGRDGTYLGWIEGNPNSSQGYSRFELHGRQWGHFIREGFYQSRDFVPVGVYRARDWRARLSFASFIAEGIRMEAGAFYGANEFERYSATAANFRIPDDYNVYGASLRLEENKLERDQMTYLPFRGHILSVWVDREWNQSNTSFGIAGRQTSLPSAVVRGGAHLEYYFPYTNTGTFILTADGGAGPSNDRVWIHDASKPIGQMWIDGRVDYRILVSDTLTIRPGARLQWLRIDDEFGVSKDKMVFWGAQAEIRLDSSENLAFVLEYSFLSNQSRRPIALKKDSIGEHRLFFGIEFRP